MLGNEFYAPIPKLRAELPLQRRDKAAILDRTGRVVSQADLIPIQLGAVTHTFRACLRHHPLETLREGDFLINNDPYSGGHHLPDIVSGTNGPP